MRQEIKNRAKQLLRGNRLRMIAGEPASYHSART